MDKIKITKKYQTSEMQKYGVKEVEEKDLDHFLARGWAVADASYVRPPKVEHEKPVFKSADTTVPSVDEPEVAKDEARPELPKKKKVGRPKKG